MTLKNTRIATMGAVLKHTAFSWQGTILLALHSVDSHLLTISFLFLFLSSALTLHLRSTHGEGKNVE